MARRMAAFGIQSDGSQPHPGFSAAGSASTSATTDADPGTLNDKGFALIRSGDYAGAIPPLQQLKLLLAKWLLNRPEVILLNEPTQAVDVGARIDILRAIRAAADRGVGVVMASIEAQDLSAVCDRVLVFRDGHIAQEMTSDLSSHAITAATYPAPVAAG